MRPLEERLVRIENPKGRFWQEKKKRKREKLKVKTRKGNLNHKNEIKNEKKRPDTLG